MVKRHATPYRVARRREYLTAGFAVAVEAAVLIFCVFAMGVVTVVAWSL